MVGCVVLATTHELFECLAKILDDTFGAKRARSQLGAGMCIARRLNYYLLSESRTPARLSHVAQSHSIPSSHLIPSRFVSIPSHHDISTQTVPMPLCKLLSARTNAIQAQVIPHTAHELSPHVMPSCHISPRSTPFSFESRMI